MKSDGSLKDNKGSWGDICRDDKEKLVRIAPGYSPYKSIDLVELDALEHGI